MWSHVEPIKKCIYSLFNLYGPVSGLIIYLYVDDMLIFGTRVGLLSQGVHEHGPKHRKAQFIFSNSTILYMYR